MKRRTVLAKKRAIKRRLRSLSIAQNKVTSDHSADAIAEATNNAELVKQLKERYEAEFEVTSEEIQIRFANGQILRVGVDIVGYDVPVLLINGTMLDEE